MKIDKEKWLAYLSLGIVLFLPLLLSMLEKISGSNAYLYQFDVFQDGEKLYSEKGFWVYSPNGELLSYKKHLTNEIVKGNVPFLAKKEIPHEKPTELETIHCFSGHNLVLKEDIKKHSLNSVHGVLRWIDKNGKMTYSSLKCSTHEI